MIGTAVEKYWKERERESRRGEACEGFMKMAVQRLSKAPTYKRFWLRFRVFNLAVASLLPARRGEARIDHVFI